MLALLYTHPTESYHVREIARLTRRPANTLYRELALLAQAGVLLRRAIGNQVHYQANPACPICEELSGILRKTAGIKEAGEFTEAAETTRWYLYDLDRDPMPGEIVASIRSKREMPRNCTTEEKTLVELRAKVEKHIKNTYLKRVDAPVGVKPALRCWMELN